MSKAAKEKASIPEIVNRYQKARQAGRRGYERADRLIQDLAKAVKPGEEVKLNEAGRKMILHDRFAEGSQKGGAIRSPKSLSIVEFDAPANRRREKAG